MCLPIAPPPCRPRLAASCPARCGTPHWPRASATFAPFLSCSTALGQLPTPNGPPRGQVGLETRDFRFDVMTNMFKKANALNNNAAHFQRKAEMGNADVKLSGSSNAQGASGAGSKVTVLEARSRKRSKGAASQRDAEMDQELVLCAPPCMHTCMRAPPVLASRRIAQPPARPPPVNRRVHRTACAHRLLAGKPIPRPS